MYRRRLAFHQSANLITIAATSRDCRDVSRLRTRSPDAGRDVALPVCRRKDAAADAEPTSGAPRDTDKESSGIVTAGHLPPPFPGRDAWLSVDL